MNLTLTALLLLFLIVGILFQLNRSRQKAREKAIQEEVEIQRKATQLLGNAALAVERGDRATADHFLSEASKLLKTGKAPRLQKPDGDGSGSA